MLVFIRITSLDQIHLFEKLFEFFKILCKENIQETTTQNEHNECDSVTCRYEIIQVSHVNYSIIKLMCSLFLYILTTSVFSLSSLSREL